MADGDRGTAGFKLLGEPRVGGSSQGTSALVEDAADARGLRECRRGSKAGGTFPFSTRRPSLLWTTQGALGPKAQKRLRASQWEEEEGEGSSVPT